MKINEFKNNPDNQVNEALSDFIGDTGSALVKSMFTGKGFTSQYEQDYFISNFVKNAVTSLDNAIKSGLVNPKIQSGPATAPKAPAAAPAAAAPAAAPAAAAPAANYRGPADITKGGITTARPSPVAKNPNVAPANYSQAPASSGNPNLKKSQNITVPYPKNPAQAATNGKTGTNLGNMLKKGFDKVKGSAKAAMQHPKKSYKPGVTNLKSISEQALHDYMSSAASAINLSENKITITRDLVMYIAEHENNHLYERSGKSLSESWRIRCCDALLEAVNLTWSDLGYNVLKEGQNYYLKLTDYGKLNNIFESIMDEADAQPESISEYIRDWLNGYLNISNWGQREPQLNALISAVENSYRRDGGKKALKQLAQFSYAAAKANKGKTTTQAQTQAQPQQDAPKDTSPPASTPPSASSSEPKTPQQILSDIAVLYKKDPTAGSELITNLIKTYAGAKPK